jgi:hypothetical protein
MFFHLLLPTGLVKIQVQQQRDRHRLSLHTQTNSDSHRHVVTGSIVETVFFLAAAIFQVIEAQNPDGLRVLPHCGLYILHTF